MAIVKLNSYLFAKVQVRNVNVWIKVIGVKDDETEFDIRLSKKQLECAFEQAGYYVDVHAVDSEGKFEFLWAAEGDESPYGVNEYQVFFSSEGIIKAECAPVKKQQWVTEFDRL